MVGYFNLLNEKSQSLMIQGTKDQSVLYKIAALPYNFFVDRKLKEIVFPTIISCVYNNKANLSLLLQESSNEPFLCYLKE